ncbi:MAG: class I SAM-dependent methyltransferase [Candidatus Sumerlaeota bacterium]|nr:class I SAM-dependent methyltransferase [Candidatus Sumerlaeota bacterium]
MEEIQCIFCAVASRDIVIVENGYTGRRCPQCGLIYVSPRPSSGETADRYGHDAAFVSAETHIRAEFLKRLYARHALRIIRRYVRRGAALEIGAGAGYFLDEARKVGFEPYAIESNPAQAEFIRNTLHIPCADPRSPCVPFEGKPFDLVYHCDVLSHFPDPMSEFRAMRKRLRDGGWLVFETGNFAEVAERRYRRIQPFQYPDHLFFFGARHIGDLLDRTGFDVKRVFRYSVLPEYMVAHIVKGIRDWVRRQRGRSASAGRREPLRERPRAGGILRAGWDILNYLLRYEVGYVAPKTGRPQSLIVVARKRRP